jgi:hypothetical protein
MPDEIALLGDSDDQFITDIYNMLKARDLPAVLLKFSEEEIPIKYRFRVLVDRASYSGDSFIRTMVKNYALRGTYVINNPFTNICDDKVVEFNICSKLRIPYPKTVVLPKMNPAETGDLVSPANLDAALSKLKFPIVLKPHDGYAWDYVSVANNPEEAKRIYESQKTQMVLIAQEMITPKTYYRVYYFAKREPLFVRYLPQERRYITSDYSDIKSVMRTIRDYMVRLNTALDYDMNACEWAVDADDNVFLIDAFNETPDLGPSILPKEYYDIVLERFLSVIEEKFHSTELNKWPFLYSP